jgi:hypothetical protein
MRRPTVLTTEPSLSMRIPCINNITDIIIAVKCFLIQAPQLRGFYIDGATTFSITTISITTLNRVTFCSVPFKF